LTTTARRGRKPAQAGPAWARPIPGRVSWRESAACRDIETELFFPIGNSGLAAADAEWAKGICARCPVRKPCLAFSLATGQQYGIWGGFDEEERRGLRRQWQRTHALPALPEGDRNTAEGH
jgi:WhiB family transcriptional regulator, redox-sensing transcriptional regulator